MRLTDPLYGAVKHHMAGHGAWHIARMRETWFDPPLRPEVIKARNSFAHPPKYLDEAGCGDEFLRFHRMMIRHFKWIAANTPGNSYTLVEWQSLPSWVENLFPAGFVASVVAALPAMVGAGTSADALGNFLEHTALDASAYSNVHNLSHGYIASYEVNTWPSDPRLTDASMSDFSEAHHNEHFWSLHSWIDRQFADWQRANGETVDVSPMKPGHHMMSIFVPSQALREKVRPIFRGKDLWPKKPPVV